jgi:hypothetical protein
VTKTDNANLPAKLTLRRYFLRKFHSEQPPRVLDCCQGSGVIWRALRKEFSTARYWGLDEKPKPGRLQIDSARILAQSGWNYDVVDIDTYGLPWKHWMGLIKTARNPVTVFLTLGQVSIGGGSPLTESEASALGLRFTKLAIPRAFVAKTLRELAIPYILSRCEEFGLVITEAAEARTRAAHARYFGLRLEPITSRVSQAGVPAAEPVA